MKRVLLVEDNRLERKIIYHILLENLGKKVVVDEAVDGLTALFYLSHQKYDLIITDLVMPQLEGMQLIGIVGTKYPQSKIIAISGSKPYYLHMAKKLGVNSVFTKPLDKTRFILTICSILEIEKRNSIIGNGA